MVLVWILVLLVGLPAFAQESFTASVDRNAVRVGETVTLSLTFNGAGSGVPQPELPSLEKLQAVAGPYSNTSLSIVNGRASSSASFSYVLRATEPGSGQIGSAKVKFKGKEFTSQPITVSIQAAGAGGGGGGVETKGGGTDVFLRVTADKTDAYVGEQITLTYKIYFCVQITNPEIERLPKATNFWVEDIALPPQAALTDEVVGGKSYKAAVIRKSALFPTASGELEVEPMAINTKVAVRAQRRMRDPFDIFNDPLFQMGGQYQQVDIQSQTLKLKIRPLPQTGTPTGFAGAVGSYKLTAGLDRLNCKTDEAVTLTVNIAGTGNIKTLPEPAMSIPADIQKFDPESSDDIRRNQAKIGGVKTFKYVIIPRAPGTQVIPAMTYAFFDPDRAVYQTVTAPELRLQVEKGTGAGAFSSSGIAVATKHGVENVGTDISFAKTRPGTFVSLGELPHESVNFWLWTVLPWSGLGAALIAVRQKGKQGSVRLGRRVALQKASKELGHAEKALKSSKKELVFRHIASTVEQMLIATVGRDGATLPVEGLSDAWKLQGFDEGLLQRVLAIQDECDRARFAPGTITSDSAGAVVERTRSTLTLVVRAQSKASVA
jgi:hypothetical protein